MSEHRPEGLGEADVRRLIRDETMGRGEAPPQATPIADSTPVGMAAFALTTFLFSIINAGWLAQIGTFVPLAFFYGGLVQLLAGLWEFRNNTFRAVVFTSYGAFWAALGFFFFYGESLGVLTGVGPSVGFTLVGWTVFTLSVWIASIKVNKAIFTLFSVFLFTLIMLTLGFLLAAPMLVVVGGYAGIILALCAWYISAAGIINHTFGRMVLPLGSPIGERQPGPTVQTAPDRTTDRPTPPASTAQESITEQPPGKQPAESTEQENKDIVARDTEET